jgi:hypothetical protein
VVVLLPVGGEIAVQVDAVGVGAAIRSDGACLTIWVQVAQDVEGDTSGDRLRVVLQVSDQLIGQPGSVPLVPAVDAGDDQALVGSTPEGIDLQGTPFHRAPDHFVGSAGGGGDIDPRGF